MAAVHQALLASLQPRDALFASVPLLIHGAAPIADVKGHSITNTGVTTDSGNVKFNSAMVFDGADYLVLADHADWSVGTAFTVEAWVYQTSQGVANVIASQWTVGALSDCAWTLETVGSAMRFYVSTGSSTSNMYYSEFTNFPLNTWAFVSGVLNGNSLRVYVDGVEGSAVTISGSVNASSQALCVGKLADSTAYNWQGRIEDLRITHGVRSTTPPVAPFPDY